MVTYSSVECIEKTPGIVEVRTPFGLVDQREHNGETRL